MIVVLGELGGQDEYSLVKALKAGTVTKPVVAWVAGTCARLFRSDVQFGHAGARSGGASESAQAKNEALAAAGAIVPQSFDDLEDVIRWGLGACPGGHGQAQLDETKGCSRGNN